MKTRELRELTHEELKGKLKNLNLIIMQSYSFMEKPKVKRAMRPQLRKEVARIKTILNEKNGK